MEVEVSPRSRLVALLLCFFFGVFGAHRFYLGRIPSAIGMLLTLGGLGIWATIDFILIAAGSLRDGERRRVYNWTEPAPPLSAA
jgi:TM2 domain-containing membrane protein YozV